jgi:hypothetical protein
MRAQVNTFQNHTMFQAILAFLFERAAASPRRVTSAPRLRRIGYADVCQTACQERNPGCEGAVGRSNVSTGAYMDRTGDGRARSRCREVGALPPIVLVTPIHSRERTLPGNCLPGIFFGALSRPAGRATRLDTHQSAGPGVRDGGGRPATARPGGRRRGRARRRRRSARRTPALAARGARSRETAGRSPRFRTHRPPRTGTCPRP